MFKREAGEISTAKVLQPLCDAAWTSLRLHEDPLQEPVLRSQSTVVASLLVGSIPGSKGGWMWPCQTAMPSHRVSVLQHSGDDECSHLMWWQQRPSSQQCLQHTVLKS